MALITFVRHAQASLGSDNYDQLSEKGMVQAQLLGQLFFKQYSPFNQVWIGEMSRHRQTAEYCLEASNIVLEPQINQNLNEFDHEEVLLKLDIAKYPNKEKLMHYIQQTDHPKKTMAVIFAQAVKRWQSGEYDEEYVETWNQFQIRCITAFEYIRSHSEKQHSLVFTSGGVISVIIQSIMQLSNQATFELNWSMVNCGITQIRYDGQHHQIISINEHQHFRNVQPSFLTWH